MSRWGGARRSRAPVPPGLAEAAGCGRQTWWRTTPLRGGMWSHLSENGLVVETADLWAQAVAFSWLHCFSQATPWLGLQQSSFQSQYRGSPKFSSPTGRPLKPQNKCF